MHTIKSSLDWSPIEADLTHKARGLVHERDVKHLIQNIQLEVTELSKAEVLSRTHRSHKAEELLKKINEDIEIVQGFLLVAALLG